MGAWGAEAFDNDAAQDFIETIESAKDLLTPLRVTNSETEIDADLASEIVVVSECVAAMRGHPREHLHGDVYEIVEGLGTPSKTLYRKAQEHLAMVWKRSELKELWEEDDPSEWDAVMADLTERLGRKAQPLEPPSIGGSSDDSPCMVCDKPVGAEPTSLIDITMDMGHGASMNIGGPVHIDCINQALHTAHRFK